MFVWPNCKMMRKKEEKSIMEKKSANWHYRREMIKGNMIVCSISSIQLPQYPIHILPRSPQFSVNNRFRIWPTTHMLDLDSIMEIYQLLRSWELGVLVGLLLVLCCSRLRVRWFADVDESEGFIVALDDRVSNQVQVIYDFIWSRDRCYSHKLSGM